MKLISCKLVVRWNGGDKIVNENMMVKYLLSIQAEILQKASR